MPYFPPVSSLPVADSTAVVKGSADPLKLARFEVDGFASPGTHVYTLPDADTALAGLGVAQTWTAEQTLAGGLNIPATVGGTDTILRSDLGGNDCVTWIVDETGAERSNLITLNDLTGGESCVVGWSNVGGTSRAQFIGLTNVLVQAATGTLRLSGTNFLLGGSTLAAGGSAVRTIVLGSGTAPTTYPADQAQEWVADISAGNAAWHDAGEGSTARVHVGDAVARQKAGTPGTHQIRIGHDGTTAFVRNDADANPTNALTITSGGTAAAPVFQAATFNVGGSATRFSAPVNGVIATAGTANCWIQHTGGTGRVTADVTVTDTTPVVLTGASLTVLAGRRYSGMVILPVSNTVAAEGARVDFDGGTATWTSFRAALVGALPGSTTGVIVSAAIATDLTVTTLSGTGVHFLVFEVDGQCNAGGTLVPRGAKDSTGGGGTITFHSAGPMRLRDMP
jgi:hypothetical protein